MEMNERTLRMQYCDDGNSNFSNWEEESIGEIGEYTQRLVFTRLGSFRNRVFKVEVSSDTKRDLMGAVGVISQTDG
jgi:hypothetical protein